MPSFEKHCQDCIEKLKEPFEEVHLWLDELFETMGPKHRDERHHEDGVKEVERRWGERAKLAAVIHIEADCAGIVPTMEQIRMWRLFS